MLSFLSIDCILVLMAKFIGDNDLGVLEFLWLSVPLSLPGELLGETVS